MNATRRCLVAGLEIVSPQDRSAANLHFPGKPVETFTYLEMPIPVYEVKWRCIMLTGGLPGGDRRRRCASVHGQQPHHHGA